MDSLKKITVFDNKIKVRVKKKERKRDFLKFVKCIM